MPKDWDKMNWSQRILWVFDKQKEIEENKF